MADPLGNCIAEDAEESGRLGVDRPKVRFNSWVKRFSKRLKGEGRDAKETDWGTEVISKSGADELGTIKFVLSCIPESLNAKSSS